jgi:hypothetical protein
VLIVHRTNIEAKTLKFYASNTVTKFLATFWEKLL